MTVIDFAEARKTKRRRVLDTGLIRYGNMSICCVVRNLSEAGAALDIGSQVGIPDQFTLIVVPQKKIFVRRGLAKGSSHRGSIRQPKRKRAGVNRRSHLSSSLRASLLENQTAKIPEERKIPRHWVEFFQRRLGSGR
jgi:hypothetical protein